MESPLQAVEVGYFRRSSDPERLTIVPPILLTSARVFKNEETLEDYSYVVDDNPASVIMSLFSLAL